MKKLLLGLGAAILLSTFTFSLVPTLQIDPIAPSFNYSKGEISKTIYVRNDSNNTVICTPEIINDPLVVNENYYLGNSLFFFPKQFQLAPKQSINFNIYVYNVDKLQGDGEFDAVLFVNYKSANAQVSENQPKVEGAKFVLIEQGVISLYKGKLVQNLTLKDMSIDNTSGGSNINVNVDNQGNVHNPYVIDYTLYDAKNEVVDTGTFRNSVKRNFATPITIQSTKPNVVKAVLKLNSQDINTKNYGYLQTYTVVK